MRVLTDVVLLSCFVAVVATGIKYHRELIQSAQQFGAHLIPSVPGLTLIEEFKSAVAAALTGTTAETVLATFNVPAGLLGANGEIEVEWDATETNSANNKTLTLRLGGLAGTAVLTHTTLSVAGRSARATVGFRNSAASQRTRGYTATDAAALTSVAGVASAVNFQLDQLVVITGTLANAGDTLTLEKFKLRFYKAT